MTIEVEWESATQRMERCDHAGATEPLDGLQSVSHCTACGKNWPSRFGAGAPTFRTVETTGRPDGAD